MDFDLNNQNDQWELKLDIDDSDLRLTPVMRPCSSTRIEPSTTTEKPVRIIPGHAGIVQAAKLLKQTDIQDGTIHGTNVLVFSPKPSMHYLNITIINVVNVFCKDIVPRSGSGVGGSGMLDEEEGNWKKKWLIWSCRELKQIEADDQAIQTILLGLPEDIYAAVDSCETAQEIWLRVQQMMKGSGIGIQEKKAKLFNE
nr:hypothetical protein [Tanacetum cinerariifolium]